MAGKDKTVKHTPAFSKTVFWEQDYTKLNFNIDKRYIITRVLSYGTQNDNVELFRYYGWDTIKEEVVNIKYLNKKTLNFLSILFEINKRKFRAYHNEGFF